MRSIGTTQQPSDSFTAKWYPLHLLWCSRWTWSSWINWELLPICYSCKNWHVGVSHRPFYLHALSHDRFLHCLCDLVWLMAPRMSPSGQFNFFHAHWMMAADASTKVNVWLFSSWINDFFPLTKVYKTSLSHSDWKNKWDLEMQWRRTVKRSSLWAETSAVSQWAGLQRCRHSWKRQQRKVLGICTFNLWLSALEKCSFLTTIIFLQADIDSPSRDVRRLNNIYKHHFKIKKNYPAYKSPWIWPFQGSKVTQLDLVRSILWFKIWPRGSAMHTCLQYNALTWSWSQISLICLLLNDEQCFLY